MDGKMAAIIPRSISEWARTQRELLKLERDEEKSQVADTIAQLSAQECMERGISLVPLTVTGLSTGLYGRACVTVGDPKCRPLPAHRLSAGDQVRLHSTKGSKGTKGNGIEEGVSEISGVVGKVTETAVEVVSEDGDEAGALRPPLRLDVVASEATHKKLMLGLDALEKYPGGGPAERVVNVLFGSVPPSAVGMARTVPLPSVPPRVMAAAAAATAGSLNDSQREAVAFALATDDVALIHGPPGTGKTTTVVSLVLEAVARGWRCLVCAPSNVAVDGILERLVAAGDGTRGGGGVNGSGGRESGRPRVVRMGHPARLLPQILEHSLEALVSRHEGTAIVKDVRADIDALLSRLYGDPTTAATTAGGGGKGRGRVRGADRKGARQEVKALRKEARARESKVVREVLRSRDVVLATCVGAATYSLKDEEFDLVVIDEAAQALEAACWIPILKGRRLVLAGDHKQLAPTVKSRKAEAGLRGPHPPLPSPSHPTSCPEPPSLSPAGGSGSSGGGGKGGKGGGSGGGDTDGLGLTMFDRVLRDLGHDVCRMLDVQYRMNGDICDWASKEMYDGLLRAHASVASRVLSGLPHASEAQDMAAAVMLLVDTTGCDMPEEEAGGGSRRNEREAEVAVRHVRSLLEVGVLESEVAVISPYNGQVNLLKRLLHPEHPGVEVRSVDGFQGGEKEAIVLSLVRSNPGKKVGFLADARRLNVAVTRAKRHVAVVCDVECCASDAFIGRLLQHIEDKGEYRSALELFPGPETIDISAAPEHQQHEQQQPDAVTAGIPSCGVVTGSGDSGSGGGGDGGGRGGDAKRPPRRQGAGVYSANGSSGTSRMVLSDDEVLALVQDFAGVGNTAGSGGTPGVAIAAAAAAAAELELPAEFTARQRALGHETAERLGLGHASRGEGLLRVLVLTRGGCNQAAAAARAVWANEQPAGDTPDENDERFGVTAAENPFSALTGGGQPRGDDSDDSDEADEAGIAGVGHETDEGDGGSSTLPEHGRGLPTAPPPSAAAEGAPAAASSSSTPGRTATAKNASPSNRAEPKAGLAAGGLLLMSSAHEELPSPACEDNTSSSAGLGSVSAEERVDCSTSLHPALTVARRSDRRESGNGLLASLHAERAARRPPAPPPPPSKGRKKGGKGKAGGADVKGGSSHGGGGINGGSGSVHGGADDWGVEIGLASGGAAGGGSSGKKNSSKKGASSTKKGKKNGGGGRVGGGGGGGGGGAAVGKSVNGARGKGSGLTSSGGGGGGDGDDVDDDMAFLDTQIKVLRAAEPCYASLLRSTTEAMRKKNPRWAAAEDKGKPSKSVITGARRGQLQGALQTHLAAEEKKRGKSSGDGKDEKKS